MEIQIAKLFRVLVIGGAVLAGCSPTDERRAQSEEADADVPAPDAGDGRDAGAVLAAADAGTPLQTDAGTVAEDAGVDSWLSWA